jgi:cell division protein ZapA
MAEVTLTIGNRRHIIACHDGEEAAVHRLGEMLDQRWPIAERAAGGMGGERAMLFVALMLADALNEAENRAPDMANNPALTRLAERLEALADTLEKPAASA